MKNNNKLYWAILMTETSHIFCCVLPTLFSVAGLLAGFGVIATIPGWLESFHEIMHGWELPVLMFSAAMIGLGWAFHFYSQKSDCHDHGCEHEPCGPRHRRASKILVAASVLLVVNAAVYFGLHRPQDQHAMEISAEDAHDHGHSHDHHNH